MGYVESLVHGAQRYMADIAGRFGTESHFAAGSGLLQRDNMKPFAVGLYGYDTGGRLYAWQAALELWKSHPVIGIGPGEFELLSPDIQRRLGASFITASAHSTYLRVLAENGVIGLVSLVIPLIFAVVTVGKARGETEAAIGDKTMSRAGGRNNALWLTGDRLWLTASLIALIANGLFMDSLHFRHLWLVFALALREVRTD
jgi:O-antigen ligase